MKTVLVVLGHKTERIQRQRAAVAVEYIATHPGVAVAVFSGHNGEAERMSRFAFPASLSAPCPVLLEGDSTHTLENIELTASLLSDHGYDLSEIDLVVIAHRGLHALRAWQCAHRYFDHVQAIGAGDWVPSEQPLLQLEEAWKIPVRTATGDLFPGDRVHAFFRAAIRINP